MKKGVVSFVFLFVFCLLFNGLSVYADQQKNRGWQDETVYYIMIDRFNDGDVMNDKGVNIKRSQSYHGGDFQGIIDQLDYIKNMGFTTIALTPINDNVKDGYHGYWIKDFYKTDEHFGSIETFHKLVKEIHKRDMKIIVDFVVTQVGPNHPWLNDSSTKKWFLGSESRNKELTLNLENQEIQQYIINAGKWWIKENDIDGYRLVEADKAPPSFLSEFTMGVKSVKKGFYVLGDITSHDPNTVQSLLNTGLDGYSDYFLNEQLRENFSEPNQSFTKLFETQKRDQTLYGNPFLNSTFMDNQQTARFTRETVIKNEHPGPRWKQALTFLYTTPGIPFVFYGSEIALDGGETPDNWKQMNFRTDQELVEYMSKIGKFRSEFPSLTRGSMVVLYDNKGMTIYKRSYKKETTVIAINNTTGTQTVSIPDESIANNKELRGMLNGDLVRSNDGQYLLTLDRDMSEIYILKNKSGINYGYFIALAITLLLFFVFIILVKKRSKK